MRSYSIKKLLNIPNIKINRVLEIKRKEILLEIKAYYRKKVICSNCKEEHKQGKRGIGKSTVEDLKISDKRVYLHLIKRRNQCSKDGRIYNEEIEWVNKWDRVTRRYAIEVNRLTAIATNKESAWYLGIDDERVYRIDKEILEEQAKKKLNPIPSGIHLSVDEVSYQKYHKYLTNVIDTDRRLLIWNEKGRTAAVLNKYYEGIGEERCKAIESVAMDGARTYIGSTQRYAINALIVYDKFHIMQKINYGIDEVRKFELRQARLHKETDLIDLTCSRQRFILLKNKNNLTLKQSNYLEKLCALNKNIYQAVLLKESFSQLYQSVNVEEAKKYLDGWLLQAAASGLESFKEVAESFERKKTFILNWFIKRISSAISEGFNNKIKRLKRMVYGYRDIDYFRLKIHQHCGLLNPKLHEIYE